MTLFYAPNHCSILITSAHLAIHKLFHHNCNCLWPALAIFYDRECLDSESFVFRGDIDGRIFSSLFDFI